MPQSRAGNWLDGVVGWMSPAAGLRRARARLALDHLRDYEGAKTGRRTDGWTAAGTSSNAEIGKALPKLRQRSRDLVRNNPYAAKAMTVLVANLIGTGITPKCTNKAANKAFQRWMKECDADGQLNLYGLQALVARTVKESGECLVRFRNRRPEDGLSVPLQIQVLEPDYLDANRMGMMGGNLVIQGVEFDTLGRRVAYWMFDNHPGENNVWQSLQSKRVDASNILHIYEKTRPGQVRGVPALSAVMLKMRDFDDYEDAELMRKKIESCFAAFVTQVETPATLAPAKTEAQMRIEALEPGMIEYLKPGEDVKFGNPSNSSGYAEYTKQVLHQIAAGIGITYEQLTGDLSQVNFSSMRAGMIEFRRAAEQFQWNTFIPMFLMPVWARFCETAYQAGALAKPAYDVDWTPTKWEYVNPVDDVKAAKESISGGLMSLSEGIRRQGYDPDQVIDEITAERQRLKKAGIVLDSIAADPPAEITPPLAA